MEVGSKSVVTWGLDRGRDPNISSSKSGAEGGEDEECVREVEAERAHEALGELDDGVEGGFGGAISCVAFW